MKPSRIAVLFFGLLLLTQFNNCTPTSDQPGFNNVTLGACDQYYNPDPNATINTDCTVSDNNNLQINPQGGDIGVNAGLTDFNIGGYCNNGAYPSNIVTWTLKLNNVPVRNSGMTENGQTWNMECTSGGFTGRVFLEAVAEDNVNRTGLYNPSTGSRTGYTLDITIYGRDLSGVLHQNTVNGTRTLNLFPD